MKRISIILLALLPLGQIMAQVDTSVSSYNESVYVQGDFKPVIEKSVKLNVAPGITDTTEVHKPSFTYGITPHRITSIFSPARLQYVKISEPRPKLYNNYVRFGAGLPVLMGDVYYNSTHSKNLNYGARLFHESLWDKIPMFRTMPDYGSNYTSSTSLSLFGKYILKNNIQLSTDLDYSHDYSMYYGFNDSVLLADMGLDRDDIKRKQYGMAYDRLAWHGGIKNLNTDVNKLGYEANFDLANLWGRYGMSEFNLNLDGAIHYGFPFLLQSKGIAYLRFDWNGYRTHYTPKTNDDNSIYLPLGYNSTLPIPDTMRDGRHILNLNPYIDFIFRRFQVHAGLNLGFDRFSYVDSLRFCPSPDVVISTSFMDDAMNISLGATGGLEANDWNKIRLVNPFVEPASLERATKHWDLYGHLRFTFSKKLELNARVELSQIKDDLNFRLNHNKYLLHNVFSTDYVTYTRAKIGADLTFVNDEMISLTLGGNYYGYIADYDLLYRPNFDASLTANVNYKDKVLVHLQGLVLGKMKGDVVGSEVTTLPLRAGLNLEVEYLLNATNSLFVSFDNILCQRYFYWCNYPSQSINFMVGFTKSFSFNKR